MSGIGSSLADLDKGVRKSVPGGWGTVAGLAAGGAGLYYGAGAGAAGAAGSAGAGGSVGGISAGGAFVPTAGSGASFALPGAASAASATGAMEATKNAASMFGAENPYMAKVIQAGGNNLGAEQASLLARQAGGMGVEGAANAIGASYQPGTFGSGAARAMYGGAGITPTQALMANQAIGGLSPQQPQGGQQTSIGMRQGQPVNTADPIAALLAPKRKKKERISLL
jgi:pilus assembly protein FimV